jgi:ATP-dependent Lon protease
MFDDYKNLINRGDGSGEFVPLFSLDEDYSGTDEQFSERLPVLVLKNTVMFPGVVIPINVGRDKSLAAIKKAEKGDKMLAVITQKDQGIEDPEPNDLYSVGVVAQMMKVLRMPDGSVTAIIQGKRRVQAREYTLSDPYIELAVDYLNDSEPEKSMEVDAVVSSIRDTANKIINLATHIPPEAAMMLQNIKSNTYLINFIASNLNSETKIKQDILEVNNFIEKAKLVLTMLNNELQMLQMKDKIEGKVRTDIEKQQRDYFLNQQLRTIQEELGGNPHEEQLKELEARAKKKKWRKEVAAHFAKELQRARRINPQMAEYSVTLNYLELILELPWDEYTQDNFDLVHAKKILDQDHYGLEDVKERILEHLAVLKLKNDMKAPILCLVGPPGVGKTSLGKSIARALKRKFIRMSLGGLHDESEIRGHRKTYIGAMPGRVIKSLKKAGSGNPVFILDEIDKMGRDFRGDPSSALLEVLDPEQNNSFYDNYLEMEYDLSKILFIATANSLSSIQPALLDRMEIIEVSGYSNEEKIEIAKKHLIPKQRVEHGLKAPDVKLSNKVLESIIAKYTRESGVRNLDRMLAALMRNIARKIAMQEEYNTNLSQEDAEKILGPVKFNPERYSKVNKPGVAVGLAWTRVGGDILFIECSTAKGKGKFIITGNLGDVMKESATTALSFIKSNAKKMGIDPEVFENTELHIHVPEGAIPKDGPSAGITMLTAITSVFLDKKVKPFLAMTGEITLRGKVLPVGGIKEKILAARRAGMKEIMLCTENRQHVEQINQDFIKGLQFIYVDTMTEVLHHALDLELK